MGGVDVFGFVGGIVVVGESGGAGTVIGVVDVILFRRFDLKRLRRCSRSAFIFCACVRGGAGALVDDGVGGAAGSAHKDLIGVCVGVLVGDGIVAVAGASHSDVIGVFSGVGEGGSQIRKVCTTLPPKSD